MVFMDILPYLSAFALALLSGIISFVAAVRKSSSEIKRLKIQQEHEMAKLLNQHKIDLEALEKKHILELEIKAQEQKNRLELLYNEQLGEMKNLALKGMTDTLTTTITKAMENLR